MTNDIDLDFRPDSYFRPQRLERYLLSQVKGAVVKEMLQTLFEQGRHGEARALLGREGVPASELKALGALHPALMGGNYLPDTTEGEVEIARIRIKSTTHDVTSVYARLDKGVIRYRVVDEYDGETLTGTTEISSEKPLTLRELAEFFLNAWPLMEVLEMNELDADEGLAFFSAESDFYPDFDRLCRVRVIEHFPEPSEEDNDETES